MAQTAPIGAAGFRFSVAEIQRGPPNVLELTYFGCEERHVVLSISMLRSLMKGGRLLLALNK